MTQQVPVTAGDDELALALDRAHVFHSWSAQAHLAPSVVAGGEGCTFWDGSGHR